MGVGSRLNDELQAWGGLAIILVVVMIVLGKMDTVAQRVAVDNGTGSANATVQSFISSSVSGLSEPANWVDIFVIALVGFGIILYIKSKKGNN